MSGVPDEVQRLLARLHIRECIESLARGEDRREERLIRASYWHDAETDYGIFKGSFDEYLGWVLPGSDAISNTQHFLGQSLIEIDGSEARAETHVISYHRVNTGAGDQDVCIGGRYLDRFESRDQQWRIAHRTMLYDWSQNWGSSADWSQGLMGAPFSGAHFTGRANGDHSVAFFQRS